MTWKMHSFLNTGMEIERKQTLNGKTFFAEDN